MSVFNTTEPVTLAAGAFLLSFTLLYIAYPDRYVTTNPRPDLPGPKGLPILGNLLHAIPWRWHVLKWFGLLLDTYGAFCTFTFPPWEWLAHIKKGPIAVEVFTEFPGGMAPVSSDGAQWRLARKTMFPISTIRSFTEHVSHAMNEIVPTTRMLLLSASKNQVPVDWNDLAGRIAIPIFARSSFDIQTNILEPDVQRLFNPFWKITEIINGDRFRFSKSRAYIRGIVSEFKAQHHSERYADFLSVLLQDLTFDDPILIRDILVTLLFAGCDNTQNALAWGLYALIEAPQWIDCLREEVKKNGKGGSEVDYQELAIQTYPVHLAVFYETVRLWPGLPKNARLALCDDVLPALPKHNLPSVKVEKGEYVFWSDYYMMRGIWGPTANAFDSGRHLAPDGTLIRPTEPNFNAFGAGPRLCPAAQLATYEFVAHSAAF
ncbi:cytochrome P450 [Fomes fomentarius]|nr:cytochrome P450 [Fomes fomentarius]